MAEEGVLFEGLRLGGTQAFEELLGADDAPMRRLARLYVDEDQVAPLVRQAWAVALPGLDMFTWHTTLRAWLTGILVTYGRARTVAAAPPARSVLLTPAAAADPGPLPWASLAWSGLWSEDCWSVLEDALAGRPLAEREVLWLHDVEGWPWRGALDTLGLTADQGTGLRHRGRTALADVVAGLVGAGPPTAEDTQERLDGVSALLLGLRPPDGPADADRELLRAFTSWRRRRRVQPWRRWWWELERARAGRRTPDAVQTP